MTGRLNKKIKKILPVLPFTLFLISPIFAFAAQAGGFITCGYNSDGTPPCDLNAFMQLINNIIKWIVMISIPISAGVFAWAGFLYMTSAVSDKRAKARDMFKKVFIGFVAILSAWLIVTTILNTLLNPSFKLPIPIG